jgi:hypothetical protein
LANELKIALNMISIYSVTYREHTQSHTLIYYLYYFTVAFVCSTFCGLMHFTFTVLILSYGREQLSCWKQLLVMVKILASRFLASLWQLKMIWTHVPWPNKIILGYLSFLVTIISCIFYYAGSITHKIYLVSLVVCLLWT